MDKIGLEKVLASGDSSVFLGNGFNLALGIDTSYKSLFDYINKSNGISELMGDDFREIVVRNKYNLEYSIREMSDEKHQKVVLDKFYSGILSKCQKRIYKFNELIEFLKRFTVFFTTNYDPLLYRYILLGKEEKLVEKDTFYTDLEKVHLGKITYGNSELICPLKGVTKKQVYEIAVKNFRDKEKYIDKKQVDYYRVIKQIRGETTLSVNDAFTINPPRRGKEDFRTWNIKDNDQQNIFYLHGALHIYSDEKQVKKIILKKGSHNQKFVNSIVERFEENTMSCVFENDHVEKLEKINQNNYLKNAFKRLEEVDSNLFVIGWSASTLDQHLIDAINNNKRIEVLYYSYYRESLEEQARIKALFRSKTIKFFDVSELPFVKKTKKKEVK